MIVICPDCTCRYNIKAEVISVEGRMMRCTACEYKWFYNGVTFKDILNEAEGTDPSDDFDQIEERLNAIEETLEGESIQEKESIQVAYASDSDEEEKKPPRRTSTQPQYHYDSHETDSSKTQQGHVTGALAALCLFALFCTGIMILKETIIEQVPFSKSFYTAIGMKVETPGEGLVFDRIETTWEGTKLKISGVVINLLKESSTIPMIELSFQSKEDEILDKGVFSLKSKRLEGEESIELNYDIQVTSSIQEETSSIKLSFLPPKD